MVKKRYVLGSMAAACLLLAGVVPAASASHGSSNDAPASSSRDAGTLAANPCTGPGTAIENVAVRRQPKTGSEQIGTVPGGARVPATSEYNVQGGTYIGWNGRQNHWWVPVNWHGAKGFVAAGWTCSN